LSYFDALERDMQRIQNTYTRVNLCPLGAGALATTSFPINRDRTAQLLGFKTLLENSIDAVSSRDFILETISTLSLIATTLSRLAEDLIIWNSPDFGVVELPDEFTSTSSIMPQKKNPEVLEIIRARASYIIGNFVSAISIIKSLPTTYNLDFQEVTPKLWESIDIVRSSLEMMHKLLPKIKVTTDITQKTAQSFVAATELANILVRKYKVPFRSAHKIVGALVKSLIEAKLTFEDASPKMLEDAAQTSTNIKLKFKAEDLIDISNPINLVEACNVKGGPAPMEVKRALTIREKQLLTTKSVISKIDKELEEAEKKLDSTLKEYLSINKTKNTKHKNST
ncbi:MAG: argininosuccinate lyase, partial [Crenarchaeota archaeon]|nr:argininosuccinate lyase [Thermoproteota archaeon]